MIHLSLQRYKLYVKANLPAYPTKDEKRHKSKCRNDSKYLKYNMIFETIILLSAGTGATEAGKVAFDIIKIQ